MLCSCLLKILGQRRLQTTGNWLKSLLQVLQLLICFYCIYIFFILKRKLPTQYGWVLCDWQPHAVNVSLFAIGIFFTPQLLSFFLWSLQRLKIRNGKSCRGIFYWGMWGEISEYKWMSRQSKLSEASLSAKLHSSKRKELKDRESFKSLHCDLLTFYETSQLLCIVNFFFSLLPWFSFFNKRCMMINEPWSSFRDGVLYRLQNTHPMRGSRAIPLGFSRSSCRIVTHVSPPWLQANILSVTRSTK